MYWYSDIYFNISDVLNDSCFMYRIKKILVPEIFFKFNNYFFSTGSLTTNKFDADILVKAGLHCAIYSTFTPHLCVGNTLMNTETTTVGVL